MALLTRNKTTRLTVDPPFLMATNGSLMGIVRSDTLTPCEQYTVELTPGVIAMLPHATTIMLTGGLIQMFDGAGTLLHNETLTVDERPVNGWRMVMGRMKDATLIANRLTTWSTWMPADAVVSLFKVREQYFIRCNALPEYLGVMAYTENTGLPLPLEWL
jgi:hypothetical protein